MAKKISFLIVICIFISIIVSADNNNNLLGEVLEVKKVPESIGKEIIKVKILEGKYENQTVNIDRERIEYSTQDFDLKKGDNILIELQINEDGIVSGKFINIWRLNELKKLSIIFFISILIFGGLRGISSLLSLIFSGFIIIKFMIPYILKGHNIMFISIISSSIIVIVSFLLISGFTKKSFVSILGTVGGTIIAGLLSYLYSNLTNITGLANEDVMFLVTNVGLEADFSSLYMSSILIGTIGVVMDVSMSITSSIFEIKKQSPKIGFSSLMHSGFKIGKDIMSTMVNTLILAYAGSSLPLIIINVISDCPLIETLNTELIAMEIIRSLCGSIGLVLTIPLTVFIASHIAQKANPKSL